MFFACSDFGILFADRPRIAIATPCRLHSAGQIVTLGQCRTSSFAGRAGPTNTGKTHLAMERMLSYQSGMIGLPLRLLAREVYDRVLAGHLARRIRLMWR